MPAGGEKMNTNTLVVIATLVGVAEAYMFMFSGFRLVGFVVKPRRLLVAAFALALFVRLSRQVMYTVFDFPFGSHIAVALASFFIIGHLWFRLPAILAAIAVVIGYMLLSLGTMLVMLLLPDIDPSSFGSIILLIAVEQCPLAVASFAIWKTNVAIVPKKVAQKLGIRQ